MTKLRTLLALATLVLSFAASAQVPQLINYQGRVAVRSEERRVGKEC